MHLGDRRCNQYCNIPECGYDLGDYVQLCFADKYTNCSYDLFTNDVCHQGCNNEYCAAYRWKSDFATKIIFDCEDDGTYCGQGSADMEQPNMVIAIQATVVFGPF